MALRTIPAVLEYAHLIEEVAPHALVVNFTNPVGVIVQAISDHSSVRVIGVCDGPIEMQRNVADFLGVANDEIHVDYAGLNHCGWIHRVVVEGKERLPEVLDRYEEFRRTEDSWGMFDPELVRALGMLPMEYLYFFYYRREALEHILRSGGTRGRQIEALNDRLWPELRERVEARDLEGASEAWRRTIDARHETYFARERGEDVADERRPADDPNDETFEGDGYEGLATAVMTAAVQRKPVPLIVNTPNRGAIDGLLDGDVVEVTSIVDEDGAHPLPQGSLPDVARALVEAVKAYERLTVEAAVEESYAKALQALLAHPLVDSYSAARGILDDYLSAHGELLGHIRR